MPEDDFASLRRRAFQETNTAFLDCTSRYQAVAWVGNANLSFTDTRSSPHDSQSEFLHLLFCLKLVELAEPTAVTVNTPLRSEARRAFAALCRELGVPMFASPGVAPIYKARIAGGFRSASTGAKPFTHEPLRRLDDLRAAVRRRLRDRSIGGALAEGFLQAVMGLLFPLPIAARMVFSVWYRAAALRHLRRADGSANRFVYFDLRLGRNRDVAAYVRWKFGDALGPDAIPFTHIARTCNGYSLKAMRWAASALRGSGCVTVNYLIQPGALVRLYFQRRRETQRVARELGGMKMAAVDFLSRWIFAEFAANLRHTNGFALEVAAGYEEFFGAVRPGVVVQVVPSGPAPVPEWRIGFARGYGRRTN